MGDTDDIIKALSKKRKKRHIPVEDYLSSGSTLLNLAATGMPNCCLIKGKYYLIVGDSFAGKTMLGLTMLAEAANNPNFDEYRLIHDNVEGGAIMNIRNFFGSKMADRLEPPAGDRKEPVYSSTLEEMYYHIDDAAKSGTPFIYLVDSMDALEAEDDSETFEKRKKAARSGKEGPGSYGMAKPKLNSMYLRKVVSELQKTGSMLIIISQTRHNIGFGAQFNPKTRSGGDALKFYATIEFWLSVRDQIKKTVRGKKRQLGVISRIRIKKNRATGRDRSVDVPIYHSFGLDDVGSCINYLIAEGYWKGTEATVVAKDFDMKGNKEDVIREIQELALERDLRKLVSKIWNEIEDACAVQRKPRYA